MTKRPITLFTGQWADLPLSDLALKACEWGFDGLELGCWGDHFSIREAAGPNGKGYCDEKRKLLVGHNLGCWAISMHLVGQAVCDPIGKQHKAILPSHVWGDDDPECVRQRAAEEMKLAAAAAKNFGIRVVNGFTGSSIWHRIYGFPPVTPQEIDEGFQDFADRWLPILEEFSRAGVRFALEVHPTEIAFDIFTAKRALEAVKHHPAFGFNFDPSHLVWQLVDPVEFIAEFPDRIFHVHMKDVRVNTCLNRAGILGSHLPFGNLNRKWDFCSLGRGSVNFGEIIRALNAIGYVGPLSVEWEDPCMDREHGAKESLDFLRRVEYPPSKAAFDTAFSGK